VTPEEAIELIERAKRAENDMDLRCLYEATTDGSPFDEWIRTLTLLDRICKLGGLSAPSEIGVAFRAAGMEAEARDYLVDAHNATPNVASLYGADIRHDMAEAFREHPPADGVKGKRTRPSRRKKIPRFSNSGDHIIAAAGGALTEHERAKEALQLSAPRTSTASPGVARKHDRGDEIKFIHRLRRNPPWLIRLMLEFSSRGPARLTGISEPPPFSRIYLVGERAFSKVIGSPVAAVRLQNLADRAAQLLKK
jgi:hypothetical protein